jgi:predicted metalloendopeptidase
MSKLRIGLALGAILGAALLVASCSKPNANNAASEQAPAAASSAPAPQANPHGIDLAGMDTSIKPGDDFFGFANGTWVKNTQIPPDRSTYGNGAMLVEITAERTSDLIQQTAAGNAPEGSEARKIGDYYASYLDLKSIDAKGLSPLQPELSEIAAISDVSSLSRFIGSTIRSDVDALNNTNFHTANLFGVWISPDFANSQRNAAYLLQGGLGLPDREFYLSTDAKMTALQGAYRSHIATVLKLAGVPNAEAKAGRIYDLEHKVAQAHVSRADSEDVLKANNPWRLVDFAKRAPGVEWVGFFKAAGLDRQRMIMVWQPGAVTGISKLVASEPLDVWKDYLTFHALDHHLGVLPRAFRDEAFAFYGKTLTGAEKPRPRWKQAVDATNNALGDAVGKIYAKQYFPPEAKAKIQAMVASIKTAFGKRIDRLDWMAPATKLKAKAKLKTLYIGVGYPERWRSYTGLEVAKGDAFGNLDRSELFAYRQQLAKLGKPVDRSEWWMTPQTVNAVNLPLQNALNFPAAYLQAPYFDKDADMVLNYGGVGATIGHEISHSFDDQGSQFDAYGKLVNWWTPGDAAHFKDASERLARQFDAYEPLPGLHVNGHQTLSENIADVAGLSASYDAYRASLGGKEAPSAQGFTGDQRFFLRFAQSWRWKAREEALRNQVLTDGHAPAPFRAATVRNIDAWYQAFPVKEGDKLFLAPVDRVRVW